MNEEFNENRLVNCGVNIDVSYSARLLQEYTNKIPDEFRACSDFDMQKQSRKHTKGVSLPQMFIHPKGSWIGGHQQVG